MKIIKNTKKEDWLEKELATEMINISPSANAKENITPTYLIIHYTATDTASQAIDWFMSVPPDNPNRIAAHIVVDLDGTITQLIPFNKRANHAGISSWDGKIGMNIHSIGIEIVNPGFVEKLSNGTFKRRITKTKNTIYPATKASKILKADHKHLFWTDAENHHWFKYPPAQLNAVYALSKLLVNHYQLITAIGHDDVSPARKPDPGPAFPWDEFKTTVFGANNPIGSIMIIESEDGSANLRVEPNKEASLVKKLNNGHQVEIIETFGQWTKVYLVNSKNDLIDSSGSTTKIIGWVFSRLLKAK